MVDMATKTQSKIWKIIIGLVIILLVVSGIWSYYKYSLRYPSTDDAYVSANLVNVAPKVGGFIKTIYVKNNQFVHKDDILLEIDPIDYSLDANQLASHVTASHEQAVSASQNIDIAQANVLKAASDYDFVQKMAGRYTALYHAGAASAEDMQKYVNAAHQSQQQLKQAKLSLAVARTQYNIVLAQLKANQIQLSGALNKVEYTQVRSAVNGFISNLNLADGQLVAPAQGLFGIVDDSSWWIDANFKETQIEHLQVGDTATIRLDMYNHVYHGTVTSISRASGNTFSILPAQNATGNWVKVTQRFTVRIAIKDDPKFPLRVGASCDVTVDGK